MSRELLEEFESMTDEQLAQLSDDDIAAIESIAQGQSQPMEGELPDVSESDPSATPPGAMSAMGMGAVEGIPFAKDALSAGEALFEEGEFGEEFNSNKQEWEEKINEAEAEHPIAFNIGDIGANVGLGFLPGGKALSTLKGGMAFGAASALSRSEDRDALDALAGMTIGAGGHYLGAALGVGAKKIGNLAGKIGKLGVVEAAGGISQGARTRFNKHALQNYMQPGKSLPDAVRGMADDILKVTADDGMPVLRKALQTPFETSQRAGQAKRLIGQKIGKILDKADESGVVIKGNDLYNDLLLKMGIDDAAIESSESGMMKSSLAKLRKIVDKEFIDSFKDGAKIKSIKSIQDGVEVVEDIYEKVPVFKDRTPKELHKLKTELGEFLGKRVEKAKANLGTASIEEETFLTQLSTLSDVLGDAIENSGVSSKEAFKKLNRQWNTLRVTEEVSLQAAEKSMLGPFSMLQDAINTKGLILGGLSHAAGMSKAASAAIGIGFNTVIKSPKTPPSVAKTLLRVAEVVKGDPNHPFTKRVVQAAALGSERLRLAVESAEAEIILANGPTGKMDRSTDSVLENAPAILSVLEYHAPELAKTLRTHLKDNNMEAIAPIMDQLGDMPEAKGFVKPGLGWDGKVFRPEQKAKLAGDIEKMDISRLQKSKLKQALKLNSDEPGMIPQVEAEPDRFLQFKTRDKKRPQY